MQYGISRSTSVLSNRAHWPQQRSLSQAGPFHHAPTLTKASLPSSLALRFGNDAMIRSAREQLHAVIKHCAYCGDPLPFETMQEWEAANPEVLAYRERRRDWNEQQQHRPPHAKHEKFPEKEPNPWKHGKFATLDHIRPQDFSIDVDQRDALANGILACQPCNEKRGNTPFIEFLQGDTGYYEPDASGILRSTKPPYRTEDSTPSVAPIKRQAAFSSYLKALILKGFKITTPAPMPWFAQALDNILYPISGQKPPATSPTEFQNYYVNRLVQFFTLMANADADFWLGRNFSNIVEKDFASYPTRQWAIRKALDTVQDERRHTRIRFSSAFHASYLSVKRK